MGFLARVERSFEDPSVPLYDSDLLDAWLGHEHRTEAGVTVSPFGSLKNTSVWAAVRVLSETIAYLPWIVYERLDGRAKRRAVDHAIYRLLHEDPNRELTPFVFVQLLMHHVLTWGNAYAEIERDGAARPVALWPIPPHRVEPQRVSGEKVLRVLVPDGKVVVLGPSSYIHVPGLGYDGLRGYSPITMHRQSIGLAMAAQEYAARWFGRGGRPPAVIKHPMKLQPETMQKLRRQLEAIHGSLQQSHRIAILDEGMEMQQIGVPAEDSQFLATQKFSVTEIARIFRVPPHKLGDLERATFSNIEHQSIEFVTDSIMPWAKRLEQAADKVLFGAERSRFFSEFLVDALLRGDSKSRADALAVRRQNGIISANEWRELDNMNPQPGEQGDVYLVPLNMIPADSLLDEEEPAAEPAASGQGERQARARSIVEERQRLRDAFRPLFERGVKRLISAEARALLKALSSALQSDAPIEKLVDLMAAFWEDLPELARKILGPVVAEFAKALQASIEAETGSEDIDAARLESLSLIYAETWGARHAGESRREILEALQGIETNDDLAARVEQLERSWSDLRVGIESEENLVRSEGALAHAMYAMAAVLFLIWRTASGACPLCLEWEGRKVGIDQAFGAPGDIVHPQDPEVEPLEVSRTVTHPPLHKGCNCHIVAG